MVFSFFDKENQPFDLGETNIRIVSEIDLSYDEVASCNDMAKPVLPN
jgi:hypothetical protein